MENEKSETLKWLKALLPNCVIIPVGSRRTCNPAPTDTDNDFLVLWLSKNMQQLDELLEHNGFTCDESDAYDFDEGDSAFVSYKRASINLICCVDAEFFEQFLLATAVAKKLNLLDKSHRVTLFQAILYGELN